MSCSSVDFTIEPVLRGDTWRWVFTFYKDDNCTPIGNIAGQEIWVILKESRDDADNLATLTQKTLVTDDTDSAVGKAVVTISSLETAKVSPGKYYYEFKRVLPGTPPDVWTFAYSNKPELVVLAGSTPWIINNG